MLFNNLISQSGGGTHTAVTIDYIDGDTVQTVIIPESATIFCVILNEDSKKLHFCAVYVRGASGFSRVYEPDSSYDVDIHVSGNTVDIGGIGYDYDYHGTLIYK